MTGSWQYLGSTTCERLGRLTLREDVWRLPTGDERVYPVLHVGPTVGVVPFVAFMRHPGQYVARPPDRS